MYLLQDKNTTGTNFSNTGCGFREQEKTKRNLPFAKETKMNHALNQNKINIQSKNIMSLAATFDTVKFTIK